MENILLEALHKAAVTLISGWMLTTATAVILIAAQKFKTARSAVKSELAKTNMSRSEMLKNFLLNMLDFAATSFVATVLLSRFILAADSPATKSDIVWALGLVAFSAAYIWAGTRRLPKSVS